MSESDLHLVRDRLAAIGKEQERLESEKAELIVAERVLSRLQAAKSTAAPKVTIAFKTPPRVQNGLTQPDLIIGTLKASRDPWVATANTLQTMIKDLHGVEIKMNSLHPLLTDLKNQGRIVRAGFKIALAERVAAEQESQAAE